mgnify:CR=1 FL=1
MDCSEEVVHWNCGQVADPWSPAAVVTGPGARRPEAAAAAASAAAPDAPAGEWHPQQPMPVQQAQQAQPMPAQQVQQAQPVLAQPQQQAHQQQQVAGQQLASSAAALLPASPAMVGEKAVAVSMTGHAQVAMAAAAGSAEAEVAAGGQPAAREAGCAELAPHAGAQPARQQQQQPGVDGPQALAAAAAALPGCLPAGASIWRALNRLRPLLVTHLGLTAVQVGRSGMGGRSMLAGAVTAAVH